MNINNEIEIIIIKNNKGGFLPSKKQINGDFCVPANLNNGPNDIEDFASDFMV
jgi:hypothetical protein